MNRAVFTSATVAALIAAAGGGFITGRAQRQPAETSSMAVVTPAAAQTSGAPIYYQDPDGKPFYSLTPMKTEDGRAYRGVPASADISFEEASAPEAAPTAPTDRKIKYYRNPMGLPDTSPTPKKDSMGMDYIPVYEGDDQDDGNTVNVSLGRIQRSGVRTEKVESRTVVRPIRAPGTVRTNERKLAVVTLRAEGYIEELHVNAP